MVYGSIWKNLDLYEGIIKYMKVYMKVYEVYDDIWTKN